MNKEILLEAAKLLERAAKPRSKTNIGFNMGAFRGTGFSDKTGHECGTTCCIAGWICIAAGENVEAMIDMEIRDQAQLYAGLSPNQAEILFFADWAGARRTNQDLVTVSVPKAVAALRKLAKDGELKPRRARQ